MSQHDDLHTKFLIHQETLNIFGYQTTFGDQRIFFTFTTESVLYRGFKRWLRQTIDWSARNQNNVFRVEIHVYVRTVVSVTAL